MRSIGLEKNASAFFDPVNLLRRTLASPVEDLMVLSCFGPRA